jgi:hypothetical protein
LENSSKNDSAFLRLESSMASAKFITVLVSIIVLTITTSVLVVIEAKRYSLLKQQQDEHKGKSDLGKIDKGVQPVQPIPSSNSLLLPPEKQSTDSQLQPEKAQAPQSNQEIDHPIAQEPPPVAPPQGRKLPPIPPKRKAPVATMEKEPQVQTPPQRSQSKTQVAGTSSPKSERSPPPIPPRQSVQKESEKPQEKVAQPISTQKIPIPPPPPPPPPKHSKVATHPPTRSRSKSLPRPSSTQLLDQINNKPKLKETSKLPPSPKPQNDDSELKRRILERRIVIKDDDEDANPNIPGKTKDQDDWS